MVYDAPPRYQRRQGCSTVRWRAQRIDLATLSIEAVVGAFAATLDAALARRQDGPSPDLARWGAWTGMAADLTRLRKATAMSLAPGTFCLEWRP